MSDVLPHRPADITTIETMLIALIVRAARALRKLPPSALRAVLTSASAGARPATYAEARAARDIVLTASPYCRGGSACLPRSIAVTLVCRSRGTWPDWKVGVLSSPPFTAHAWVEAAGDIVDEPLSSTDFTAFFAVKRPDTARLRDRAQDLVTTERPRSAVTKR